MCVCVCVCVCVLVCTCTENLNIISMRGPRRTTTHLINGYTVDVPSANNLTKFYVQFGLNFFFYYFFFYLFIYFFFFLGKNSDWGCSYSFIFYIKTATVVSEIIITRISLRGRQKDDTPCKRSNGTPAVFHYKTI